MKSNFYEKILSFENESQKTKANKIMNLLNESVINCIDRRKYQIVEKKIIIEKKEQLNIKANESIDSEENYQNNNESNRNNQIRGINHNALRARIINYEQENEELFRLIERNSHIEVVG